MSKIEEIRLQEVGVAYAGYPLRVGSEGVKQLNVENSGDTVRFYRVVVE